MLQACAAAPTLPQYPSAVEPGHFIERWHAPEGGAAFAALPRRGGASNHSIDPGAYPAARVPATRAAVTLLPYIRTCQPVVPLCWT